MNHTTRPRRALWALALATALTLVTATPASAAVALQGEQLSSLNDPMFEVTVGPQDPTGCDPTGSSTAAFDGNGPATGPLPGTMSLSGSMSLGPQADTGQGPSAYGFAAATGSVTDVTGGFAITSGTTSVIGTFTGLAPALGSLGRNIGSCYGTNASSAFGYTGITSGTLIAVDAHVTYTATVTGPGGTESVSGKAFLRQRQTCVQRGSTTCGHTGTVLNLYSATEPADSTPPELTPTVSPNPVEVGQPATADAGASDPESGIVGSSCEPVDTSVVGTFEVTCEAVNGVGLTSTESAEYEVVPPPDVTDPTITITTPTDGDEFMVGDAVTADFTCDDESGGSGIASCVGTTANGAALDTSQAGPGELTVTAVDNAGNQAELTHVYTVVEPPPPTPATKADCKKGGWRDLVDDEGQPFKNQGQCVSYLSNGGPSGG